MHGNEEKMTMNLEEQRQFILNGNMYNDLSDELVEAREKTVFLTNEYNASFGKPAEEREAILKKLFKSIGKGVHFEPNFRCEFGYNISIGNNFYANFDCIMLDGGALRSVIMSSLDQELESIPLIMQWMHGSGHTEPAMRSRSELGIMSGLEPVCTSIRV